MSVHFYGVSFGNVPAVSSLAAVRLVGQPDRVRPVHITTRGPLQRRLSAAQITHFNEQVSGASVSVVATGRFESDERVTLFLRCFSHHLWRVWRKRDFPDLLAETTPHITLFDGPRGATSDDMAEALESRTWQGALVVSRFAELERDGGLVRPSELDAALNAIHRACGVSTTAREIAELSRVERSEMMDALAEQASADLNTPGCAR